MLLLSNSDKSILSDVYIICNTPRTLYGSFRANSIVQDLANSNSTKDIIELFIKIGEDGIGSIEDLAYAYELYIALTFKEYDDVFKFYSDKGNINFEWFPEIKDIYLKSYKHTNKYTLTGNNLDAIATYTASKYDLIDTQKWNSHEITF